MSNSDLETHYKNEVMNSIHDIELRSKDLVSEIETYLSNISEYGERISKIEKIPRDEIEGFKEMLLNYVDMLNGMFSDTDNSVYCIIDALTEYVNCDKR